MEKDGGQLFEGEMSWIYDKEDLVTLRPGREHAWLDGILERMLSFCRGPIVKVNFLNTPHSDGPKQADNTKTVHLLHPSLSTSPSPNYLHRQH